MRRYMEKFEVLKNRLAENMSTAPPVFHHEEQVGEGRGGKDGKDREEKEEKRDRLERKTSNSVLWVTEEIRVARQYRLNIEELH